MNYITACLAIFLYTVSLGSCFDPDIYRNTTEQIKAHGYLSEIHDVTTEDGYILTVIRIPGKESEPRPMKKKQPVYMQPGIFCMADVFTAAGPKKGAAYFLVNAGYDVWIVNSRGTFYSKKHIKYTTRDKEFWEFTLEEQGVFDQRAVFEYIVAKTGYQKVHFWSHSQGGTQMMAALTLDPEFYRKRLLSAVLTGPVFRFDLTKSPFIKLMNYTKFPQLAYEMGSYEFLPYNPMIAISLVWIKYIIAPLHYFLIMFIADENPTVVDMDKVDVFFAHFTGGTSTKAFKHLIQLTEQKGFYKYRERSSDPIVLYPLEKIPDVPVAVFSGRGDLLSTPEALLWFQEELIKAGKNIYFKFYDDIGHIPFLTPVDSRCSFLSDGVDFFKAAEMDQQFTTFTEQLAV